MTKDFIVKTYAFNLELGDIDGAEHTLEEIFKCLALADKPCIVRIDKFQQTSKYPEKNIEVLQCTHIQKIKSSNFIFAGSERSMMQAIFLSSAHPLYRIRSSVYISDSKEVSRLFSYSVLIGALWCITCDLNFITYICVANDKMRNR